MAADAQRTAELQQRLDTLLRQQRDLVASLEGGQAHFRRLARSVWRVQEDERRRFARELHDGIGQNLTAVLRLLEHALQHPDMSPPLRRELERARSVAHSTLAEARALSRQLRPQILDDLGLDAALRWLARSFGDTHELDVHLDLEQAPALEGDAATLVFRVAQEGLTNVAKHAGASVARLSLRAAGGHARLRLSDDGRGCDMATTLRTGSEGQGSGLGGMRDRALVFGAQLRVLSEHGAGFTLELEFPFAANAGTLGAITGPE